MFKKIWNIISGKDLNWDGKVDIKDKFVAAEIKSGKKVTNQFKPKSDHNGDASDMDGGE